MQCETADKLTFVDEVDKQPDEAATRKPIKAFYGPREGGQVPLTETASVVPHKVSGSVQRPRPLGELLDEKWQTDRDVDFVIDFEFGLEIDFDVDVD